MAIKDLREELKKIISMEKELTEYVDKHIGDLPRETRQRLNDISVIPHTTAVGLEYVKPVYERLFLAQTVIEERISELENKAISQEKKPETQPQAKIPPAATNQPQPKSNPNKPTPQSGPQPKSP